MCQLSQMFCTASERELNKKFQYEICKVRYSLKRNLFAHNKNYWEKTKNLKKTEGKFLYVSFAMQHLIMNVI